jgi:hypothetical protein
MTTNQALAVNSSTYGDTLMVVVTRPTYIQNGREVFDAVITGTRLEATEAAVGTTDTFLTSQSF